MRVERMVIESGGQSLSISLASRLTIIAGVGELERDGLAGELIGSLSASRAGVHTELIDDRGRRLAVFRPLGGRPRVVDIAAASEVTEAYRDPNGAVDLLGAQGIDNATARRTMRAGRTELASAAATDELVARLAEIDQTELWAAAARARVTDEELQAEAAALNSTPEDADLIDRIEAHHQHLEGATTRHQQVMRRGIILAALSLVIGVPIAVVQPSSAQYVLAVGVVVLALLGVVRAQVRRAVKAEERALDEAGANSYLSFQLARVDDLVQGDQQRQQLAVVAREHRQAAAQWAAIAGDVSVDWAMEHHEQIETAVRLRTDLENLGAMSSTAEPDDDRGRTADMAQALIARIAQVRNLGGTGESFPLILDEPFEGLSSSTKSTLLELLARTSASAQTILLTDDEDIISWGRIEAMSGEVRLLEPTPSGEEANPASDENAQHSVA